MDTEDAQIPFAQRAASFSFLAPLFSIIGMIGIRVAFIYHLAGPRPFAVIAILLPFAGLLMGVVALFGVRKHGRERILAKAIWGICLNFVLIGIIALAAFNFLHDWQRLHQPKVWPQPLRWKYK